MGSLRPVRQDHTRGLAIQTSSMRPSLTKLRRFAFLLPMSLLLTIGCSEKSMPEPALRVEPDASSRIELEVPVTDPAASETPSVAASETSAPEPRLLPKAPETLTIGDPSPGLEIAKWIKGSPVNGRLTDGVHVVEFWATWCGPCLAGMPHISELQKKFDDKVTFIGVTREDEATVDKFLNSKASDGRTWNDVIEYRLAIDDRGWTNTAYMRAAGQNGIPCAFIVGRDGVVDWIGHPGRIDEPLKKIVDGDWDREAAIAEFKQQQRLKEMSAKLSQLARSSDWDGALELLDQFEKESGKSTGLTNFRLKLLQSAGRTEEASAVRSQLVDDAWDQSATLNEFAWSLVSVPNPTDLDLALKAARRASELTDDKDPGILDTVARCYYESGELDEAIRWQNLAVEKGNGNPEIDAALKRYLDEKAKADNAAETKDAPAKEAESVDGDSGEKTE